jgi:hypothetical protein
VQPGGEALELSWDQLTGIPDFSGGGYLVFCARGGELPVFSPSFYNNQYTSCPTGGAAATVGGPDAGLEQAPIESAEPNGTRVVPPPVFTTLDPAYQCSELLTSQTSVRIRGLQNGIPYVVGVAAVDKVGNASPITDAYLQFPIATADFYRGYRAAGGSADGGYCAVAPRARMGLPLLVLAAALALSWRARRRR